MIKFRNVYKSYTIQKRKRKVFDNLSIQIGVGERIALMGKNGVGKSTFLRLISGIEKPDSGQIIIKGIVSWHVATSWPGFRKFTGVEIIKFIGRIYAQSSRKIKQNIEFVKNFSEIDNHIFMPLRTYSAGMALRFQYALSMAFDFDFYLVDEVLEVGDMDFKEKSKIYFEKKIRNKGLILASHDIRLVKKFCNSGLYITPNQVIYSKDVEETIELYRSNR